jgi:hypothetical protein
MEASGATRTVKAIVGFVAFENDFNKSRVVFIWSDIVLCRR